VKRAEGVAQVIKLLPSKHAVLVQIPYHEEEGEEESGEEREEGWRRRRRRNNLLPG
jgi:hypothetical protein